MPRALKKRKLDGELYLRRPEIDASIDLADSQSLQIIKDRLECNDRKSSVFIPEETLVSLTRDAVNERLQDYIDIILPCLLNRCYARLKRRIKDTVPNAETIREDILSNFALLFLSPSSSEDDSLDYFEVNFNHAFLNFRVNHLRKETKKHKELGTEDSHFCESPSQNDEPVQAVIDLLKVAPSQEENTFRLQLAEAITNLTDNERHAVMLHYYMDYKIESKDPSEKTVSVYCGVSERTVRNWLDSAHKKLAVILGEKL